MTLRKGLTYTNDSTDLAIRVLSSVYKSTNHIKFRGLLFNKRNGIVYEMENYKLPLNIAETHSWEELKEAQND